jgi:copper homeostasis protein
MLLEICANSFQSAINAEQAGAHRIELCSELSVGGITPSFGLLKKVLSALTIPVNILIRPRSGDFVYSQDEFDIMKRDIELCKNLGASGIVSGILTVEGNVDNLRTKALIELAKPMDFTFHRAFDELRDPLKGLEQLIDIGVDRILTSGQQSKAEKGLESIKEFLRQANNRVKIMAGAGITAQNVSKFKAIGIKEVHASASVSIDQQNGLFSLPQTVSDPEHIRALLDAL